MIKNYEIQVIYYTLTIKELIAIRNIDINNKIRE